MVADNSTVNVTVVRDNTSGTGGTNWTVDTTVCNLSLDTSIKDFVVTHNGTVINNSFYTKNSATQITYTGAALTGSTTVQVVRRTPVNRLTEVLYGTKLSSSNYEAELNRIHRILTEFELNGSVPSGSSSISDVAYDSSWNGIINVAPSKNAIFDKLNSMISDVAYAASWDGDTTTAPSRNAVYDRLVLLATLASPALTGTPTAPNPSAYTDSTQIATTNYALRSNRPVVLAAPGGAQSINNNTVSTVTLTESVDPNNVFASNTFTAPQAGIYELSGTIVLSATCTQIRIGYRVNAGADVISFGVDHSTDLVIIASFQTLVNLALNDTVEFRARQINSGSAARTISSGRFSIHYVCPTT